MYGNALFLKALVIMTVKQVFTVNGFLGILAQPTAEMCCLRRLLTDEGGRFPTRRTWERRLAVLPLSLPAPIACLGRLLVVIIQPWAAWGRAAAIDSTVLQARGGVWHQKDREVGVVPHSSIDTQAHWTKSGWHGWVYGWKLHVVCTAAAVWIPLMAHLTPANAADNEEAPPLIRQLLEAVHFLLGDQHYRDQALETLCAQRNCILVTTWSGKRPSRSAYRPRR
ncbi:MAG TPA: transposase [Anaerolineales bacterium]|nr:transposase [Anaerolineales bacterium]